MVLFARALWLCRLAQGAGGRAPVRELTESLASRRWLPHHAAPDAVQLATLRASSRGARWFGLRDTCLVRSLVAGALLSDHDDVLLHVGFARGQALEGHAWVSVAGTVVGGPESAMAGDRPATELTFPVVRGGPTPSSRPAGGGSIDPP